MRPREGSRLIAMLALGIVCTIAAEDKSAIPLVKPGKAASVSIAHPVLQGEWIMRFPEVVETTDAIEFYAPPASMRFGWRDFGEAAIGYDWDPGLQAPERIEGNVTVRQRVRIAARLRPSANRIDLSLELTNPTGEAMENVWSDGGCLQHQSELFIDPDASRTFIKATNGLLRLSDTDRTQRIRCAYVYEPRWYEVSTARNWEYFWGRSKVRPSSALVASVAKDGKGAIGIGFDHAMRLYQNSDKQHHCMHSAPYFGTLKPGEKRVRRGVILFGQDAEELFDRFEKLGYRPDFTSPSR